MFDKFKPFFGRHDGPNRFYPLNQGDILRAEHSLGFPFPDQLRAFYLEIGYGSWCKGVKDAEETSNRNFIFDPESLVEIFLDEEEYRRPPEGFEPDEMPCFEVNLHHFLVMKPQSSSPNTVYNGLGTPLGDFEEFMSKLYEHAKFWLPKPPRK